MDSSGNRVDIENVYCPQAYSYKFVFCHNLEAEMEQFPHFEMNDEDWERIEIRAEEREEFSQPCAICRDELGCRAHVSYQSLVSL